MKFSAAAMNAALRDFKGLQYSKAKVSMFEPFLTAKWMESNGRYPDPAIVNTNTLFQHCSTWYPGRGLDGYTWGR